MSKYYIIARKKDNTYTTIDINGGNNLEDIDIYTSRFNNKKSLLEELHNKGLDTREELDLFIIGSDKNNNVRKKQILYKTKSSDYIVENAKRSLDKKDIDTTDAYNKIFKLINSSNSFSFLVRRNYFDFYKTFKDKLTSGKTKLELESNERWLLNSYSNYRDVMASMLLFKGLNLGNKFSFEAMDKIIKSKELLKSQRSVLDEELEHTLKGQIAGQINMLNNNNAFVHIDYIDIDEFEEDNHKSLKKESKTGFFREDEQISTDDYSNSDGTISIDKESVKYINFHPNNTSSDTKKKYRDSVLKFLTSDEYFMEDYIKEDGKKNVLNYERVPFTLNNEDKKYMNSLISTKMLGLVREYSRLSDFIETKDGMVSDLYQERSNVYNEMKRCIDKYGVKSFNNIVKFSVLYKDCMRKAKINSGVVK